MQILYFSSMEFSKSILYFKTLLKFGCQMGSKMVVINLTENRCQGWVLAGAAMIHGMSKQHFSPEYLIWESIQFMGGEFLVHKLRPGTK